MSVSLQKRLLLRWVGWFFFANILLSIIVQATYMIIMPSLSAIYGATVANMSLAYFFLFVSYIAHATVIYAIVAAVALLFAWFIPRKGFVIPISLLLALVVIAATVIDRFTYRLYHAHQFAVGIIVLKSGAIEQVMPLSSLEYLFLVLVIVALIALELFIAWRAWRGLSKNSYKKPTITGYKISAILAVCVCVSYTMMAFVVSVPHKDRFNDTQSHLLLKMARLVPYYQNVYDFLMPGDDSNYRTWHVNNKNVKIQTSQLSKPLNYPLHPMQCLPPKKKPNIIFLVFDTLRYDSVTPKIMPNVYNFAKKTVQFDDVFSGGNCTQPGVFSLFYGIPANYWASTVDHHTSPVLVNQLTKAGYQMGIFASASLLFPQFEDNVFVHVKHYRVDTPGDSSMARDKQITKLFKNFVAKRNPKKPFFSFIFYDSVHNYCEGSTSEFMAPFKPAVGECARFSLTKNTNRAPYINRYHNAAYFLDEQAKQVFATLKKEHLLNNTIVVITADHGEQHNDEHMDYWSHASAYTPYQLHIPMMIYWPGMKPQHRDYFASNMDVAPTLLQRVLNCKNLLQDYTVGKSIFSKGGRPYLISGSYTDYAYVTPKQIIRVYPGGDYIINGPLGHHQYQAQLNVPLLKTASKELTRYYK
jgi:membrane-anchored protein YejM (alkaline phosphatase superfamily)